MTKTAIFFPKSWDMHQCLEWLGWRREFYFCFLLIELDGGGYRAVYRGYWIQD